MTIGRKLYLGFGLVLGLVGVISIITWAVMAYDRSGQAKTAALFTVQQQTADIGFQMMQNRQNLGNYLLSGDTRGAEDMGKGVTRLDGQLERAIAQVQGDNDIRSALQRIRDAEQKWKTGFADPLVDKRKQVDAGNSTVAELQIFYLQQDPTEWLKKSKEPLDEAQAAIDRIVKAQQKSSENASSLSFWFSIIGTLGSMTGGLFIAFKISQSITQPLGHLISVAREIGNSGDLDQTVDINRDDEIGELAKTFNNMVGYLKEMAAVSESIAGGDLTVDVQARSKRDTLAIAFTEMIHGLRSMVKSVRDGASQVASGSNEVASASDESARINVQAASAIDEVTSTMHEMSINVQNMVKNTQTQASSVSETSASIDQMVASIQRVADTAKVLLDISQRSREEVQSGIVTMEKATNGLNRINQAIESSATIIGDLGQKTDDIGKIVEVIDDLAEQTNLLALNAAIEAARAGEHGLGFAVVADEVRKLAEKSAQSTREISELISSIQKEARKAVENMDKSTTIVDEGLGLGTDLGTALKKISNVVTEVYKFAQEIGAATNEQSNGSTQIAKATGRLNEITHEINSSVEEQASGAQAVVRAMEKMRELTQRSTSGSTQLAASSEEMSKMARTLLESMDRFVLESSANGHGGSGRGMSRYATSQN
ncbi:MAG: methyl-accepting chemotaxis sensory transducer [Candidatus Angelobacter sp.]|nr:methyl-accepting chemotaxis sensory transducer [Candidatus Angelobacter sp.]